MVRTIQEVIVHCTYTPRDMDVTREDIDRWHERRGFKSESGVHCGYHRIIYRDGRAVWGRPFREIGAHCKGRNVYSIGIALVGGMGDSGTPDFNFTYAQLESLRDELLWIRTLYGDVPVVGHRNYADKECPVFHVEEFVSKLEPGG